MPIPVVTLTKGRAATEPMQSVSLFENGRSSLCPPQQLTLPALGPEDIPDGEHFLGI